MAGLTITTQWDSATPLSTVPRDAWKGILLSRREDIRSTMHADIRFMLKTAHEVLQHEAWSVLGHATFRDYVEFEFDIDFDGFTGLVEAAKHIGYRDPIPFQHAEEIARRIKAGVARAEPLAPVGRPSGEAVKGDVVTINNKGNAADYLLRRLARDNPDQLAAYERGEHRSVRQAAIAAGIVRVDLVRDALRLIRRMTPDQRATLREMDW